MYLHNIHYEISGRFRIISRASERPYDQDSNDPNECKMYHVQELADDPITYPHSVFKQTKPCYHHGSINNQDYPYRCKEIQYLSTISHVPSIAYAKVWPWKLMKNIIKEMESNDAFHGLLNNLPPSSGRYKLESDDNDANKKLDEEDDDDGSNDKTNPKKAKTGKEGDHYEYNKNRSDPVSFSFWLAANLPLSIVNKLDVLEMNHIQRLRYLLDMLIKQRNVVKYIKCKNCGSKLAKMNDLFTVAGAEGTSGAYGKHFVNQNYTLFLGLNLTFSKYFLC